MDRIGETIGGKQSGVRTASPNLAVGTKCNREGRMRKIAIVQHRPDWVGQSGMAGDQIGGKASIGNTDCSIGYGSHPLARMLDRTPEQGSRETQAIL